MYGICSASIKVADGKTIGIIEETKYPFDESVKFTVRNSSNCYALLFNSCKHSGNQNDVKEKSLRDVWTTEQAKQTGGG